MDLKPPNLNLSLSSAYIETEEPDCSICLGSFKSAKSVSTIECNHSYHNSCIVDWLQYHDTCPLCRKDLSERKVSYIKDALLSDSNLNDKLLHEIQRQNTYGRANARTLHNAGAKLPETELQTRLHSAIARQDEESFYNAELLFELGAKLTTAEIDSALLSELQGQDYISYKFAILFFKQGGKLSTEDRYNALINAIKSDSKFGYYKTNLLLNNDSDLTNDQLQSALTCIISEPEDGYSRLKATALLRKGASITTDEFHKKLITALKSQTSEGYNTALRLLMLGGELSDEDIESALQAEPLRTASSSQSTEFKVKKILTSRLIKPKKQHLLPRLILLGIFAGISAISIFQLYRASK